MTLRSSLSLPVVLALLGGTAHAQPRSTVLPPVVAATLDAVTAPPPALVRSWGLAPSYVRYLAVDGMPILGSAKVSNFAIREAAFLVRQTIGHRPEILHALAKNHVRFTVMAPTEVTTDVPEHSELTPKAFWNKRSRGLGATPTRPAVSCGEENLLNLDGDPYVQENILIHELSHAIHLLGMNVIDPTFDRRLHAAFDHARRTSLWAGTYAMTNADEYWAEGAQSWFDTNRRNDAEHGPIATRAQVKSYDPQLAKLLVEVYGDRPYRYQRLAQRRPAGLAHLAGFDRTRAGRFVWPTVAPEPAAVALTLARGAAPRATPNRTTPMSSVVFANNRKTAVEVLWVGYDGHRLRYATVQPGRVHVQSTFAGHVWVIHDGSGDLGVVHAATAPGRVEIR